MPDTADQGIVDLVVTIGGENFGKGSKVAFYVTGTTNPGGIVVKGVEFKDSKTLDATIDVAPDAQTELKFDIQVDQVQRPHRQGHRAVQGPREADQRRSSRRAA